MIYCMESIKIKVIMVNYFFVYLRLSERDLLVGNF